MGEPARERAVDVLARRRVVRAQAAYADLVADAETRHGVRPDTFGAIGVSAMMHGYLAFDAAGELLTPFRTWRNTNTGDAATELTELFGVNIPLRWSIAHLHQAVLDAEEHVPNLDFVTTLAGYVHSRLTGRRVLGVGDASGMFPIDSVTCDFDARMIDAYDARAGEAAAGARHIAAAGSARCGRRGGCADRRGRSAARPVGRTARRHPAVPAGGRCGHRHGGDELRRASHGQRLGRHEHLRDGGSREGARERAS